MKVAVILTAMDQMSDVIDKGVNKSLSSFDKLHKAQKSLASGMALIGFGREGLASLDRFKDAFAELEEKGNDLKTSIMGSNGILDASQYDKIVKSAQSWSDVYKAPTGSYLDMIRVMKNNRLDVKDILGGIGKSAAQLSDYFKMNPAATGEFSARMKNDIGVQVNEMGQMMDLVARIHGAGVGKTGEEAVSEMTEFYSKVGLGLANLHVQGIQAGKEMGILGAMFMNRGLSGQTVGNNFRRILDGMRDPKRVNAVLGLAQQYGKSLEFYNKDGKFIGIQNMVMQLGKLQGLEPNKIAQILNPFSGKQGLSTDFLEFLSNEGITSYNELLGKIENQASLQDKLKVVMGGLNYEQDAYHASLENLKASIGEDMEPLLYNFYSGLHKVTVALREFVQDHPTLTKIALGIIAIVSSLIILAGAIKVFYAMRAIMGILAIESPVLSGVMATATMTLEGFGMTLLRTVIPAIGSAIAATWSFTVALLSNPITWIVIAVLALSAAAYWVVKNWDKVKVALTVVWKVIKQAALDFWNFLKNAFLNYTIPGLIIKNWDKIKLFFSLLWAKIKSDLSRLFTWFITLPKRMYDSGKALITNLWNGITSKSQWLIEKVKNIAQKIRNLWPFSPAKEGPLKDIHRIKLMETIAATIKPQPVLGAMNRAVGSVASFAPNGGRRMPSVPNPNNSSYVIHFSPNINLHGSATPEDGKRVMSEMETQFRRLMDNYFKDKSRKGF